MFRFLWDFLFFYFMLIPSISVPFEFVMLMYSFFCDSSLRMALWGLKCIGFERWRSSLSLGGRWLGGNGGNSLSPTRLMSTPPLELAATQGPSQAFFSKSCHGTRNPLHKVANTCHAAHGQKYSRPVALKSDSSLSRLGRNLKLEKSSAIRTEAKLWKGRSRTSTPAG